MDMPNRATAIQMLNYWMSIIFQLKWSSKIPESANANSTVVRDMNADGDSTADSSISLVSLNGSVNRIAWTDPIAKVTTGKTENAGYTNGHQLA